MTFRFQYAHELKSTIAVFQIDMLIFGKIRIGGKHLIHAEIPKYFYFDICYRAILLY